jgi:pyroglutamyl-peptidase
MSTILVTGFEAFDKSSLNPSGEIVKALIGDDLVTAILPVVFGQASSQLKELIDLHNAATELNRATEGKR